MRRNLGVTRNQKGVVDALDILAKSYKEMLEEYEDPWIFFKDLFVGLRKFRAAQRVDRAFQHVMDYGRTLIGEVEDDVTGVD